LLVVNNKPNNSNSPNNSNNLNNMINNNWWQNLKVGDEVYWNDPNREEDEGCSGFAFITGINGEIFSIKKHDGGEVEAFKDELT